MSYDDSLLRPELGEQVMKVLSRLQTLPEKGIIAGQAVASAIDEILGTGTPVYNDIDCFRSSLHGELLGMRKTSALDDRKSSTKLSSHVTYSVADRLDMDTYAQRLNVLARNLYQVLCTEEDGLINNVEISWMSSTHFWFSGEPSVTERDLRQLDLIRVFDLNNVQASVDLTTGRLVVSDAFREFFRTRQMRLSNLFTPVHTALRLVKKAQELSNVYVDLEGTLKMLNVAIRVNEGTEEFARLRSETMREGKVFLETERARAALNDGPKELKGQMKGSWIALGEGLAGAPMVFGRKYFQRYEQHAAVLRRHIEVQANDRETLFLAKTPTSSIPLTLPALSLEDTVRLAPADLAPARLEEQLKRAGPQLTRRRALFAELLQTLPEDKANFVRKAYAFHGDAYLEGFDSENEARKLFDTHKKHVEFSVLACVLPLKEQLRVCRGLRRAFKDKLAGWGILSGFTTELMVQLVDNPEFLALELQKLKDEETPLVAPLPLPEQVSVRCFDKDRSPENPSFEQVSVRELRSRTELMLEGNRMGHCVGGYGGMLEEGDTRILSLSAGPSSLDSATVEWRVREMTGVSKVQVEHEGEILELKPLEVLRRQVQGRENSIPLAVLTYAEQQVREELNIWLSQNVLEGWKILAPHRLTVMRGRTEDCEAPGSFYQPEQDADYPW